MALIFSFPKKVLAAGRITIPEDVRLLLDVKRGDQLFFAVSAKPFDTKPIEMQSEWTIKTIKKFIHIEMQKYAGSPRYYMRTPGFAMIAAKLDELGAPTGLVDSTIEHYRQNPNQ